jgi:formylglycine-generating enzyme required for sulfatase activity
LKKENNKPEGGVARVLRGGSYLSSGRRVRCASRNRNYPYRRLDFIGFRVVVRVVSPISL